MAIFDWHPFLIDYSRELLADRRIKKSIPEAVFESGWMGYEPASENDLLELESRIGVHLPESYRQFLASTDGWRDSGRFIYEMLSCRKVEWFRTNNQSWIDAYLEPAEGQPPLPLSEHCVYGDD